MNKSNLHPDRHPLDAMLMGQFKIEEWRHQESLNFQPNDFYIQSDVSEVLLDLGVIPILDTIRILPKLDDN